MILKITTKAYALRTGDRKISVAVLSKKDRDAKKLTIKQKKDAKKNWETGQKYLGYRRFGSTVKQDVTRSARKQPETCSSKFCFRSVIRQCNSFSETERSTIFQYFWKMKWCQKKFYVCNLIECVSTKRKYFLMKSGNKKVQVCIKMFLNTLGIKEKMLRCWLNSKMDFGFFENPDDVEQRKVKKRQQGEVQRVSEAKKLSA